MPKHLRRLRRKWYVQKAVPHDIRGAIGKAVIVRPLNTESQTEAERLAWAVLNDIEQKFARARQGEAVSPDEVKAAGREALRTAWAALVADPVRLPIALPEIEEAAQAEVSELEDAIDGTGNPSIRAHAVQSLARLGVERSEENIAAMYREIVRGIAAAAYYARTGQTPPRPGSADTRLRFKDAAKRYLEDKTRDEAATISNATRQSYETTFRLFSERTGNPPVTTIKRTDVGGFLSTIGKLDPAYSRSAKARTLPLSELLKRYGQGSRRLGNATLNRHLTALSGFFKWTRGAGLTEGENPAAEQSKPTGRADRSNHVAWTVTELTTLLRSDLFAVSAAERTTPKRHTVKSALRWLSMLGIFTGMRANEFASLRPTDVQEADGIPFLAVTEDGEGRTVKTASAVRHIPIHSALIRAGFLRYVEYVRGQGHEWLFPGLKAGGADGRRAKYLVRAFAAHRKALGITRDRVTLHGLRANCATALERGGARQNEAARILGHAVRGLSFGLYSHGLGLDELRAVVEKISYPGLDLRHLDAPTERKSAAPIVARNVARLARRTNKKAPKIGTFAKLAPPRGFEPLFQP